MSKFDSEKITSRLGSSRCDSTWVTDPSTGNLKITTYPSKPGILKYKYRMDDGSIETVRELVTKEVLHNAEVLASLENKFLLNEHKFDSNGAGIMITSKNAKEFSSGWTTGKHEVAADGNRTRLDAIVSDDELIKLIKANKRQVSPGYEAKTSGVGGVHPVYGKFDTEQTWRNYNHLSVTWKGRMADPEIGIRVDGGSDYLDRFDAWEVPDDIEINKGYTDMQKIKVGGHDVEVSSEAVIAFETFNERMDSEKAEVEIKVDSLQKENQILLGKVEALETELKQHVQLKLDSELKALQDEAILILGKEFKDDGLDSKEIKAAIVQNKYPEIKLDGMSLEKLDGMFEVAKLAQPKTEIKTDSFKKVESIIDGVKTPDADPIGSARNRNIKFMTEGRK